MSLFWTRAHLDDFGDVVRISLSEELRARNAASLVSSIVQNGHNQNPVITIKTKQGTKSFQVERTPENTVASPAQMRILVASKLDSIGI